MTAHLKLRIHVAEPWDFARQTGTEDLAGWTVDYVDEELEEWEIMLDASYKLHDVVHGRIRDSATGSEYTERQLLVFDAGAAVAFSAITPATVMLLGG